MNIIHNRHDSFFRKILSDNEIATDYLKSYLPSNISEKLDFSTLTEVAHTYVSKELRQRFADIVFTCKLRNETDGELGANVQISILIEHKSYVDKFAPFQIGSYLFSGYLKQIKNSEDLMPIIPILFYHGRDKWEHKSIPELFDNLGHDFLQFIPNFEYLNHSLWDLSDKQIEDLSNHFLTASLLTLKHCLEQGCPARVLHIADNIEIPEIVKCVIMNRQRDNDSWKCNTSKYKKRKVSEDFIAPLQHNNRRKKGNNQSGRYALKFSEWDKPGNQTNQT